MNTNRIEKWVVSLIYEFRLVYNTVWYLFLPHVFVFDIYILLDNFLYYIVLYFYLIHILLCTTFILDIHILVPIHVLVHMILFSAMVGFDLR